MAAAFFSLVSSLHWFWIWLQIVLLLRSKERRMVTAVITRRFGTGVVDCGSHEGQSCGEEHGEGGG